MIRGSGAARRFAEGLTPRLVVLPLEVGKTTFGSAAVESAQDLPERLSIFGLFTGTENSTRSGGGETLVEFVGDLVVGPDRRDRVEHVVIDEIRHLLPSAGPAVLARLAGPVLPAVDGNARRYDGVDNKTHPPGPRITCSSRSSSGRCRSVA